MYSLIIISCHHHYVMFNLFPQDTSFILLFISFRLFQFKFCEQFGQIFAEHSNDLMRYYQCLLVWYQLFPVPIKNPLP